MAQPTLFRETQHMRSKWLWGVVAAPGLGVLLWAAGAGVLWATAIGSVVLLLTTALLYSVRLTTEVREDGVYVRFAPFHRSFRRIPSGQIAEVEVTELGLLTYGGIGIRWTPGTVAYITSRGSGVKIDRPDRKSVVVGSQDADRLAEMVDDLR